MSARNPLRSARFGSLLAAGCLTLASTSLQAQIQQPPQQEQQQPPPREQQQEPLPPPEQREQQEPPEQQERQEQEPQRETRQPPQRQPGQMPPARQQAQGSGGGPQFNYTHAAVFVGDQELPSNGSSPEGDLIGLSGGMRMGESGFAQLEWQQGDYDELGERNFTELSFGFQENYTPRTSWYIGAGFVRDDWSDDELERDDGTFLRGRYGFRWRVTDGIETDLAVVYTRPQGSTEGDSEWSGDVGLSFYFGERFAVQARARDLDGLAPNASLGLRIEFDM